jgi:hypothetical protein
MSINQIGRFDRIQVVLNHHDGVAGIAQLVQHFEQQRNVGKVQSGGGLVQDVQSATGVALRQFQSQLHTLCLPPDKVVAAWPKRM